MFLFVRETFDDARGAQDGTIRAVGGLAMGSGGGCGQGVWVVGVRFELCPD